MGKFLTKKQVIDSFIEAHGYKYDYSLVTYLGNLKKIKIMCSEHGKFTQTPKSHKRGNGCPKCSKNYSWGNKFIINQFNKIHNNKYNYDKMEYKNDRTKINIICDKHGNFTQSPNNHKKGKGCPKCGGESSSIKQSMSLLEFIKKSNKIHNDYYTYENTNYVNNSSILSITCPRHGSFNQQAKNHLIGKGCHKCRMSKGEKKIEEILIEKNINYISQKTFNNLRSDKNKHLRFDFYLPDHNLCLEYNGKQHYECIDYFGGIENFKRRIELDKTKKKYCINNNINYMEISYLDMYNIPKILNNI